MCILVISMNQSKGHGTFTLNNAEENNVTDLPSITDVSAVIKTRI